MMNAEPLAPIQTIDPFSERLALADRILLALMVYSMLLGLWAIYQWGFDVAFMRVLGDFLALGVLVSVPLTLVSVVMAAANWHRRLAGAGLVCASYFAGLSVWCGSVYFAWVFAGTIATLIGVAVFGFGVVPVAVVGSVLRHEWLLAGGLTAFAAFAVINRWAGRRWAT